MLRRRGRFAPLSEAWLGASRLADSQHAQGHTIFSAKISRQPSFWGVPFITCENATRGWAETTKNMSPASCPSPLPLRLTLGIRAEERAHRVHRDPVDLGTGVPGWRASVAETSFPADRARHTSVADPPTTAALVASSLQDVSAASAHGPAAWLPARTPVYNPAAWLHCATAACPAGWLPGGPGGLADRRASLPGGLARLLSLGSLRERARLEAGNHHLRVQRREAADLAAAFLLSRRASVCEIFRGLTS